MATLTVVEQLNSVMVVLFLKTPETTKLEIQCALPAQPVGTDQLEQTRPSGEGVC